jgi:nucleoside-diphosphate-sugar epimerase
MSLHLVTGGAGFIGSHIAEELLRQGERVRILDNLATGKRENVEALPGEPEFIEGDVCDPEVVRRAVADVEIVYHQAAIPSVPRSIDDPFTTNRAAVDGTLQLIAAAREAGVRRMTYASSSSVYGEHEEMPTREDVPTVPISPYAVAKLTGELYTRLAHRCWGLEAVTLRYFNVYGPRQDPASMYAGVTPIFVREMLSGNTPTIFGDGEQTRDFTYVTDVVQANLKAAGASSSAVGCVFNAACGVQTSVNRLYELVAGILGFTEPPNYAPPRAGDIRRSEADISAARDTLGYEPRVPLEEGLRKTIDWLKTQL